MNDQTAPVTAAGEQSVAPPPKRPRVGSLTRRMIVVAAFWITALLLMGGFALDRVLSRSIVDNFDQPADNILNGMIGASEIGPDGEVRFTRPPADQRFVEPYSGVYFQVSGEGADTFPSRSLWDRRLRVQDQHNDVNVHVYDSNEFAGEPLRITERDITLPGSQGSLALPGRPVARDHRHPNPRPPRHLVLELPGARHRPADACRSADRLRPLAAPARQAGRRRDPLGSERLESRNISRTRSSR